MSTIRVDNFGPSAGGTTYSAGGIAKAWVNFNGQSTVSIRDSLNVGSITDTGAGSFEINFSSSFANINYSTVISLSPASYANNNGGNANIASYASGSNQYDQTPTASRMGFSTNERGGSAFDPKYADAVAHGDLA